MFAVASLCGSTGWVQVLDKEEEDEEETQNLSSTAPARPGVSL